VSTDRRRAALPAVPLVDEPTAGFGAAVPGVPPVDAVEPGATATEPAAAPPDGTALAATGPGEAAPDAGVVGPLPDPGAEPTAAPVVRSTVGEDPAGVSSAGATCARAAAAWTEGAALGVFAPAEPLRLGSVRGVRRTAAAISAALAATRRRTGASRCCQPGLLSAERVGAEACRTAGGRAPGIAWCAPPSPGDAPGGAPAGGRWPCLPVSILRTGVVGAALGARGVTNRAAPVVIGPAARTSERERTGTEVPVIRFAKPPGT